MNAIKIYGADWCARTRCSREHLDELGLEYGYVNVDADALAREWVKRHAGGRQKTPTIEIDGLVLIAPSVAQLEAALAARGLRP